MTVSTISANYAKTVYSIQHNETSAVDKVSSRQDVAAITTAGKNNSQRQSESVSGTESTAAQVESKQQESFLNQLMEQMLANRIGLDKQKYDEIKQKIDEIEQEKEALAAQDQSPARDSKIALLEDKQEQLNHALVELVEQAKRNREQNERAEQVKANLIDNYRTAAYTEPKTKIIL